MKMTSDGLKSTQVKDFQRDNTYFKRLHEKTEIRENNIMNETDSQRVYNYPFYPRDSINFSDKVTVKIDDAIMA